MKQTLCFGWIYSKFSTSLFLVSDTFLTTSVSRDSRLSELWVSPPSQGSRSFSLCSPLIRPVTAASVKLSETWRKECIYLCTAWYHTHACTHARRLHSHCLENKVLIMLQEPLREFLQQTSIWRVWRFRKTHRVTSKHRFNRILGGGGGGGGFLSKKKKKSNFLELALVSLEVWARLVNKGRVLNHCQSM